MIDQGLKSIMGEPADGIFKCQGLLYNGSFKTLEQHLQKLVENCEKTFGKTFKIFSELDCTIITPLRLDLDHIFGCVDTGMKHTLESGIQ